ncbi:hypothetical protein ACQKDD_17200 [Planococcus kocurii]|uniref:hypothetical protein n=2 Tax=Planococcus kocurii TaxID=1374 RepID=UPI003D0773E8
MIKNKLALFSSFIILAICMYLFFPFPNNVMIDARITFMSFPILNQDGYILLGIIGSILFIAALTLLFKGLKKYQFRILFLVVVAYAISPSFLIAAYQETLGSGVAAISYDNNGQCNLELVDKKMNGKCNFILHNRSNEAVSFELEFIDTIFMEETVELESLMNLAGPYRITIEANQEKTVHLNELLDVTDVQEHIGGGTSTDIHFKLIDNEGERVL